MSDFQAIRAFLASVGRRARAVYVTAGVGLGGAAATVALGLAALAAADSALSIAARAAVLAFVAAAAAAAAFPWLRRALRLRRPGDVARYVGALRPALASDLLSAIELEPLAATASAPAGAPVPFSADLLAGFARITAERLGGESPSALVPGRLLRRTFLAAGLGAALLAALAGGARRRMNRGLRALLGPPRPPPLALALEPILGDIDVRYVYPAYTGLPPQTLKGTAGDLSALPGTRVTLRARSLFPVASAALRVDDEPLPVRVDRARDLEAELTVARPGAYRFVLVRRDTGEALGEPVAHAIETVPDQAPRVELRTPGDDLEVTPRQKVELRWQADDDYGLSALELVYRIGNGAEQRRALAKGPLARSAQGTLDWDLGDLDLLPGARVAYHVEAKDNDTVPGPNTGASRTFALHVYSARGRHAGYLAEEQRLLALAITVLADRLERPVDPAALAKRPADLSFQRTIHDEGTTLVTQIAALLRDAQADPMATHMLAPKLSAMESRLGALDREEGDVLAALAQRRAGASWPPSALRPLASAGARSTAELEDDVLLLDDLLGHERLGDLAALGEEVQRERDRIRSLLEQYKRTHDPALEAEIERDLRDLAAKLAEMEQLRSSMIGEVPDEFLNADAFAKEDPSRSLKRLEDALQRGDVDAAERELAQLSERLDQAIGGIDRGFRDLRDERFTREQKQLAEMMDHVADLERQERSIADDAQQVLDRYKDAAKSAAKDKLAAEQSKAQARLDALRKAVGDLAGAPLASFDRESQQRAAQRLDQAADMLKQGGLDDAAELLRGAQDDLQGLSDDELDAADRMAGEGQKDAADDARRTGEQSGGASAEAGALAQELESALPKPGDLLSAADRDKLAQLAGEQAAAGQQAGELAKRAGEEAKKSGAMGPGTAKGLAQAQADMGRSEGHLKTGEPRGGHDAAEDAARRLGELRGQLGRAQGQPQAVLGEGEGGGDSLSEQEVKIPGAEDYQAPRAFRQDILDAAKQTAPPAYQQQVRRYYEELVK